MSRKKVLFTIESLGGGGAEKVLSTITRFINRDKFDVTVCSISNTGIYSSIIASQVNYCYVIPNTKEGNIFQILYARLKYYLVYKLLPIKWVYKLFIPKDFDIEIAFVEGFVTKLMASSINRKSYKIAWVHIDLKQLHWTCIQGIYKDIKEERACYENFDKIVCVSKSVKHSFKELFHCKDERLINIYNPIDADEILSKSKGRKCSYVKRLTITSVGRFVPQKGYDILIKVLGRLKQEKMAFNLVLVGEGAQQKELERLCTRYNLEDSVEFVGFKKNPYSFMANSDIFVCSSRAEGYSLVIAEALVLGIAVLSTNCSGPTELLENGQYGLIVENTEEGLYKGLKLLIQSPDLLKSYKMKAKEKGLQLGVHQSLMRIEKLLEEA